MRRPSATGGSRKSGDRSLTAAGKRNGAATRAAETAGDAAESGEWRALKERFGNVMQETERLREELRRTFTTHTVTVRRTAEQLRDAVELLRELPGAEEDDAVRYSRGVLETLNEPILLMTRTFRVVSGNPAFFRMTGSAPKHCIRRSFFEIDDGAWNVPELRNSLETLVIHGESFERLKITLSLPGSNQRTLLFTGNALPRPNARFLLLAAYDMTHEQQIEKDLERARENLEQRVFERTIELARVNEVLSEEVAARRKGERLRQELLRRLTEVQEKERMRLSRELHDQTGQQLTALILGLNGARNAAMGAEQNRLDGLVQLAEGIDRELDQMALALRPPVLDDIGLLPALRQHVEEWEPHLFHSGAIPGFREPPQRLSTEVETALYRFAQEALTNVHKHASARRVSIVLQQREDQVMMIIEDDGQGFNPTSELRRTQLGLLGMRERIALLGGSMDLESSPGEGTSLYLRIPTAGTAESVVIPR